MRVVGSIFTPRSALGFRSPSDPYTGGVLLILSWPRRDVLILLISSWHALGMPRTNLNKINVINILSLNMNEIKVHSYSIKLKILTLNALYCYF